MKVCSKCKEEKSFDLFHKNKGHKDGYNSRCKMCANESTKEWQQNNREKHLKLCMDWYRNNVERHNKKRTEWKDNNPIKVREMWALWKVNNPEKSKESRIKSDKKAIETVADSYVKNVLIYSRGFTKEQINQYPEIIETERLIIKTKRLCKTSQN